MNVTLALDIFTTGEKTALGLFPVVLFALGYAMYRWVTRTFNGEADMVARRLHVFYNLSAGILWGHFFFHSLPNATTHGLFGYRLRSIFFLVGYCFMLGYDRMSRIMHENVNYVAPPSTSVETDFTLNRRTKERGDYIRMDGDDAPQQQYDVTDEVKDLRKRRFIAYFYYAVATFNCMVEGLFFSYSVGEDTEISHALLVVVFCLNKLLESIALFTILMHAKLYSERNWRRWVFFCMLIGWPLTVLSSVMFILVDYPTDAAVDAVSGLGVGVFYGIFAGILLWYAVHFQHFELRKPTRREIKTSFFTFFGMALLTWFTGYFV